MRLKGWIVIKVDLKKAYDRLNYDFIKDILKEVSVPNRLITLT